MSTEFVSHAGVTLNSTSGHCAILEPGVPKELPEALHAEALMRGCVEFKVSTSPIEPVAPIGPVAPIEPVLPDARAEELTSALQVLITRNDPDSFNKLNGMPIIGVVRSMVPFAVTSDEVNALFTAMKAVAE